jgi:hypothetical protein
VTRVVALTLAAALAAPSAALAEPRPVPPEGEHHLVLRPGQTLQLAGGGTYTTPRDGADLSFGGVYASPRLARWDLEDRRWLKLYAETAVKRAEDERWSGFAVGGVVGVAVGVVLGLFVKGLVSGG